MERRESSRCPVVAPRSLAFTLAARTGHALLRNVSQRGASISIRAEAGGGFADGWIAEAASRRQRILLDFGGHGAPVEGIAVHAAVVDREAHVGIEFAAVRPDDRKARELVLRQIVDAAEGLILHGIDEAVVHNMKNALVPLCTARDLIAIRDDVDFQTWYEQAIPPELERISRIVAGHRNANRAAR